MRPAANRSNQAPTETQSQKKKYHDRQNRRRQDGNTEQNGQDVGDKGPCHDKIAMPEINNGRGAVNHGERQGNQSVNHPL